MEDIAQIAQKKADGLYNYFFLIAKNEGFNNHDAHFLALKPAEYVYTSILSKNCIDTRCCLEYCIDCLDTEFNTFTDDRLERLYVQAGNVQPASRNGLRDKYRLKRINFKKKYFYDKMHSLKMVKNVSLNMDKLSILKRPSEKNILFLNKINIINHFKTLKLK